MKKLLIALMLILALTLCFAACGDDSTETPTIPTHAETQKPTADSTEKPTESPTVAPTEKPTENPTEHVHEYGDWVVRKEATCTENGIKSQDCACGNYKLDYIPSTGHTPLEAVEENRVEPTGCTTPGSYQKVIYCGVCKAEVLRESKAIPANGHTEEVTPSKDPTCTETGLTEGKHCSVCEEVLVPQYILLAKGHSWEDATVTAPKTCSVCGATVGEPLGPYHTYFDFTSAEKAKLQEMLGTVIPFIPNDEYYFEDYALEEYGEYGINFYAFGNTEEEFDAYLELFSDYTNDGTDIDEYGDTWYLFSRGDIYVDLSFYLYDDGIYIVDVYAYFVDENNSGGSTDDPTDDPADHIYLDFTSAEKAKLQEMLGTVIPFIPNDEYYFEDYALEEYGEYGINFYAFGNTEEEFKAYLELFSDYTNDGTDIDEYGDTWYLFSRGDIYVDLSFYLYDDGIYIVDVYAYFVDENNSGGGSGDWEDTEEDVDLITNNGAGLPEDDGDGIYDIDFTDAEPVKNVTDQGMYLDGCPTVGSPAVLVIPVEFSDATAQNCGYSIENIKTIFNGTTGDLNYFSVHDYFFVSSYGKLDLDITVLDEWFRPEYNSSYYENSTMDDYGYEMANGDQLILDEALAYLSTVMDLSEFDSDGNGTIDAVVMVNTLDIDDTSDFHWAYRYWNMLVDDEEYYYEYDGVSANDYAWIPYQFMFEYVDEYGDTNYDADNELNPYTFIHEFSHVLGADDYYDTEYVSSPLGGYDIMDAMIGDHNPYSKFNFGWITSSKLITTDSAVTVALEDFSKNGDTIIIANNWDSSLGVYQEYYVVMYYTAGGLNGGEGGYFTRDGIVIYHVNASLYREEIDGEVYYDVYNSNTDVSGEYGTADNLIEYVKSSEDHYIYVTGETLDGVYDDSGNKLGYTFTVDAIDGEFATLTFEKVA